MNADLVQTIKNLNKERSGELNFGCFRLTQDQLLELYNYIKKDLIELKTSTLPLQNLDITESQLSNLAPADLKRLLEGGADPNKKFSEGQTLAHIFCRRGDHMMLSTVLNFKPDLSIKDDKGMTPLDIVLSKRIYGRATCLELLSSYEGVDITEKRLRLYEFSKELKEIKEELLDFLDKLSPSQLIRFFKVGIINVNTPLGIDGQTINHLLALRNKWEHMKALKEFNPNFRVADRFGNTAREYMIRSITPSTNPVDYKNILEIVM